MDVFFVPTVWRCDLYFHVLKWSGFVETLFLLYTLAQVVFAYKYDLVMSRMHETYLFYDSVEEHSIAFLMPFICFLCMLRPVPQATSFVVWKRFIKVKSFSIFSSSLKFVANDIFLTIFRGCFRNTYCTYLEFC